MQEKTNAKMNTPTSDFSRYEDKQEKMDESHSEGNSCYLKGSKNDSKKS